MDDSDDRSDRCAYPSRGACHHRNLGGGLLPRPLGSTPTDRRGVTGRIGEAITWKEPTGCSNRLSSKATASEEAKRNLFLPGPPIACRNRRLPRPYVESLSDARTPLADFFNSLLEMAQALAPGPYLSSRI